MKYTSFYFLAAIACCGGSFTSDHATHKDCVICSDEDFYNIQNILDEQGVNYRDNKLGDIHKIILG